MSAMTRSAVFISPGKAVPAARPIGGAPEEDELGRVLVAMTQSGIPSPVISPTATGMRLLLIFTGYEYSRWGQSGVPLVIGLGHPAVVA